jgi:hypothetical protein
MADLKAAATEAQGNAAKDVKKKLRRGVSNATQAVAQLRFHEKDAAQNGLFVGHLESVTVDWSQSENSKSFPNMKVPRLTFHFESNHPNINERRHVYQTLFPVESNIDTIPGGSQEWMVNNVMNWIKHILDVFYLKGRQLTEAEEDALSLPFIDYDEEGNYVALDPEEILAGYRQLFENAAAMLNGSWNLADGETAKPVYKTADGKPINVWMKLLRHKKRKNEWVNVAQNGELGFDTFIGNGCIEIMKGQNPPTILRLDLAKESITPKEVKKAPNLGGIAGNPLMAGGAVMAGGVPQMGAQGSEAFNAAQDDMPF